jgi:hypothetical protein
MRGSDNTSKGRLQESAGEERRGRKTRDERMNRRRREGERGRYIRCAARAGGNVIVGDGRRGAGLFLRPLVMEIPLLRAWLAGLNRLAEAGDPSYWFIGRGTLLFPWILLFLCSAGVVIPVLSCLGDSTEYG